MLISINRTNQREREREGEGEGENNLQYFKCKNRFRYDVTLPGLISFRHSFVCVYVEVIRSSQSNWVISSAVCLLNHTFTGKA